MQLTALLSWHLHIECPLFAVFPPSPHVCLLFLTRFKWPVLVFLRLRAAGGICISSGLAPLGSMALFTALPRVFRSTREKKSDICFPCQGPDLHLERWSKEKGSCLSPVGSLPGATAEEAPGKSRACTSGSAALSSERRERIKSEELTTLIGSWRLLSFLFPYLWWGALLFAIMDNLLIVLYSAKSREDSEKAAGCWFI